MGHSRLLLFITFLSLATLSTCQDSQRRLVCSMVTEDTNNAVEVKENAENLEIVPFSFSGDAGLMESFLPFLKDLPKVESPEELPPVPVATNTQNISVKCDVVADDAKKKVEDLEEKVELLTRLVEKLEDTSACPGGVSYLNRCFRLMEISGKNLPYHKAEDLCNFHGGVLARIDNALVSAIVTDYLRSTFQSPRYGNKTVVSAWTGMKYEIDTQGIPDGGIFVVPVLTTKSPEDLNKENQFLAWYPGFPRPIVANNRIALQFRFQGPDREVEAFGSVNFARQRRLLPLCQFNMDYWRDGAKISSRLFKFN